MMKKKNKMMNMKKEKEQATNTLFFLYLSSLSILFLPSTEYN